MSEPRSDTETIISALRTLARDIKSGDGVANACCSEAADRLEEYHRAMMEIKKTYSNTNISTSKSAYEMARTASRAINGQ